VIVADTDVLIDALRGREPARTRVAEALAAGQLATTTISAFELRSSADTDHARAMVEQLLSPLAILPFDDEAAAQAVRARRALDAPGSPIGIANCMIAGICLARSASLVTRDRALYGRVAGLVLADLV
jgi:predicted nucleic acid-binding protein